MLMTTSRMMTPHPVVWSAHERQPVILLPLLVASDAGGLRQDRKIESAFGCRNSTGFMPRRAVGHARAAGRGFRTATVRALLRGTAAAGVSSCPE